MQAPTAVTGGLTGYLGGVRLLGRGVTLCVRNPSLLVLGLVPVVVVAVLFTAALAALVFSLGDLAAGATWFADGRSGLPDRALGSARSAHDLP